LPATITNNGFLQFSGTTTAGSATITNNGSVRFVDTSTGGMARFINGAGGNIDLSALTDAGMTAGSIEGAGTISLGSNNLAVGGNNLSTTFSGVLQDVGLFPGSGGSLTKTGTGTTTLTGNNTYSGGTTLAAGTLAVGSHTALGTGALTIGNGTTLQAASNGLSLANAMTLSGADTVDTQTNALTLFGTISGSGGLTKIGSGVLTLSGANTYSGGTTLAAGTLSLANDQALGTGTLTTGSVVDYANGVTIANPIIVNSNTTQLQVTSGSATQAGVISELNGPRPLEKIGAGTLILTATNTYSGPTTITGGTLQLGNGGTSGSILGNVVNNGIFAINRFDTFTFGNVISGSGAFQQNGSGTTILTATNT
jgi:fibronectin-binding autotransporter adhesin